jgi:predicted ATPase/class 3 adenylate cyclase
VGSVPSGTITFLFTDIEGSTSWWEREPAQMAIAVQRHDVLMRAAIEAHGGFVFATGGDAFAAAFSRAGDAVAGALTGQRALQTERWPEPVEIAVRMGIHTGEAQERDDDYFGPTVNRAARIMARAAGGQVLVSLATEELVRDRLPTDVEVVDLGVHRLASMQRPERVFEIAAAGLRSHFPPLLEVEEERRKGNLPRSVTSFVGRSRELKQLGFDVPSRRLVTITGPGGVGKSRLAIEAAAAMADLYPDGVWFVDLVPATDIESVASITAATLDVQERPDSSVVMTVVDALRARRALVVVDNCEHVIGAAAELVSAIVADCPAVTLLATSRTPLGLASEEVWPIAPFDAEEDVVQLFADRARSADARYEIGEDHDVVGAIGRRLDGMPLAIELAAARVRSMSAVEILRRLDERFRLLRGGGRDRVERHQTLQATIDWSYQLLTSDERMLFARLSVMAATFALDDAEAVCAAGDLDVGDLLTSLVDKSMVVAERTRSGTRFRELETLRQYGTERLEAAGEIQVWRRRHLEYYRSLARAAADRFEGTENVRGRTELEAAWSNIRTALYFACAEGELDAAVALLDATYYFSYFGLQYEQGDWAERVLQAGEEGPVATGIAAYWRQYASLDEALAMGRAGIARSSDSHAPETVYCWQAVLCAAMYSGRMGEAVEAVEIAEQISRATATTFGLAEFLGGKTNIVATIDPDGGLASALEAQRLAGVLRNRSLMAWTTASVGVALSARGDTVNAIRSYREALEWASGRANRLLELQVPLWLAMRAPSDQRPAVYAEVLARLYADRHWLDLWVAIESLVGYWARADRPEPAAVLLGHLESHGRGHGAMARQRARVSAILTVTHAHSMAQGAAMDRDELVDYALAELEREAHSS